MPEKTERHTAVLVGVGGSGVVWSGTLLARAGLRKYEYITRLPNFTTAMRGGPCECMLTFSNEKIPSPLVALGDTLVVLENSQLKPWERRVHPRGIILLESTGLREEVDREDVEVLKIPAVEIAYSIGERMLSSLVLLGSYVQVTGVFPPEFVQKELEAKFGVTETGIAAAEKQMVLSHNLEAFRRGLGIGEDYRRART